MKNTDDNTEAAARYLRENASLRAAVGAADDAVLEPHYLGVGEHNLNYRFQEPESGRQYVLRVNVASQPFHENQVAYEFAALRELEPANCAPRPVFLDDTPTALGKGVIVETFCSGKQLDFDHLVPGEMECAVQLMADVHAQPVSDGCPLYRPADPLRELFEECLQRFKAYKVSGFEEQRLTKWVERFIAAVEPQMDASACRPEDCTHIVNTETLPSHFIISENARAEAACSRGGSGRFCAHPGAFVDWERPLIGEVAQDVAYFVAPTTTFWDSEWLCSAKEAEGIVADYWRAVDGRFSQGSFEERFPLYRAMTALRSTTWCCRALAQYNLQGTHKTEKTARKLPRYLSDDFLHYVAEECLN